MGDRGISTYIGGIKVCLNLFPQVHDEVILDGVAGQ